MMLMSDKTKKYNVLLLELAERSVNGTLQQELSLATQHFACWCRAPLEAQ
jgi:hypothetical protein